MENKYNVTNLWTLTELRQDDPRNFLETLIALAHFGSDQAIKLNEETVYVISEAKYKKLIAEVQNDKTSRS